MGLIALNLRSQMEHLFHVSKATILKGRAIENNLKDNWFKMSQSDFLQPVEPNSTSWRLLVGGEVVETTDALQ